MYTPGEWWVLCDQCQRKMLASEATKRWDGKIVHADPNEGCWETRHPQEFVRAVRDQFPLPFTRPDNDGIEATLEHDCDCHYPVEIPYHLEVDQDIFKGFTNAPASGVIIESPAVITVYCEWIIE